MLCTGIPESWVPHFMLRNAGGRTESFLSQPPECSWAVVTPFLERAEQVILNACMLFWTSCVLIHRVNKALRKEGMDT